MSNGKTILAVVNYVDIYGLKRALSTWKIATKQLNPTCCSRKVPNFYIQSDAVVQEMLISNVCSSQSYSRSANSPQRTKLKISVKTGPHDIAIEGPDGKRVLWLEHVRTK